MNTSNQDTKYPEITVTSPSRITYTLWQDSTGNDIMLNILPSSDITQEPPVFDPKVFRTAVIMMDKDNTKAMAELQSIANPNFLQVWSYMRIGEEQKARDYANSCGDEHAYWYPAAATVLCTIQARRFAQYQCEPHERPHMTPLHGYGESFAISPEILYDKLTEYIAEYKANISEESNQDTEYPKITVTSPSGITCKIGEGMQGEEILINTLEEWYRHKTMSEIVTGTQAKTSTEKLMAHFEIFNVYETDQNFIKVRDYIKAGEDKKAEYFVKTCGTESAKYYITVARMHINGMEQEFAPYDVNDSSPDARTPMNRGGASCAIKPVVLNEILDIMTKETGHRQYYMTGCGVEVPSSNINEQSVQTKQHLAQTRVHKGVTSGQKSV